MRILLSILTYIGILVFAFAQTNIQVKKQDGTIGSPDPNPNTASDPAQNTDPNQDAYIDEAVLGLPHKPISGEDRKDLSKKTISVIEEYYNSLENTIVNLKDSELETVRLNLIESIHTSSLTKKNQKESDKPIHEKNLYHLNRTR